MNRRIFPSFLRIVLIVVSMLLVLVSCSQKQEPQDNRVLNMESLKDGLHMLSIIVPADSDQLDTILVPSDRIKDLHISRKTFKLVYAKHRSDRLLSEPRAYLPNHEFPSFHNRNWHKDALDTIYVNYGKDAITDSIPRAEIPRFPKRMVEKFFAKVPTSDGKKITPRLRRDLVKRHNFFINCGTVLSDTITLNYKLSVLEGPDEIELQHSGFCGADRFFSADHCGYRVMVSCLPPKPKDIALTSPFRTRYRLVSRGELPAGKKFKWKIRYTDQYGRGGIIKLKTVVSQPKE